MLPSMDVEKIPVYRSSHSRFCCRSGITLTELLFGVVHKLTKKLMYVYSMLCA